MIRVGTAGWTLPRAVRHRFPRTGTHLARYASLLHGVEINSSFYRPHARETYERWAASTPREFRFAVKLPRAITHEAALRRARVPLVAFLAQARGLGRKLGPLLVQLPGSMAFEAAVVRRFLAMLRDQHDGTVVVEPRHESWFTGRADALLEAHRVARVAADPARFAPAATPGGWPGCHYYRLHGAPRMYWSPYPRARLREWAAALARAPRGTQAWCLFDNTASGAALGDALQVVALLRAARKTRRSRS